MNPVSTVFASAKDFLKKPKTPERTAESPEPSLNYYTQQENVSASGNEYTKLVKADRSKQVSTSISTTMPIIGSRKTRMFKKLRSKIKRGGLNA